MSKNKKFLILSMVVGILFSKISVESIQKRIIKITYPIKRSTYCQNNCKPKAKTKNIKQKHIPKIENMYFGNVSIIKETNQMENNNEIYYKKNPKNKSIISKYNFKKYFRENYKPNDKKIVLKDDEQNEIENLLKLIGSKSNDLNFVDPLDLDSFESFDLDSSETLDLNSHKIQNEKISDYNIYLNKIYKKITEYNDYLTKFNTSKPYEKIDINPYKELDSNEMNNLERSIFVIQEFLDKIIFFINKELIKRSMNLPLREIIEKINQLLILLTDATIYTELDKLQKYYVSLHFSKLERDITREKIKNYNLDNIKEIENIMQIFRITIGQAMGFNSKLENILEDIYRLNLRINLNEILNKNNKKQKKIKNTMKELDEYMDKYKKKIKEKTTKLNYKCMILFDCFKQKMILLNEQRKNIFMGYINDIKDKINKTKAEEDLKKLLEKLEFLERNKDIDESISFDSSYIEPDLMLIIGKKQDTFIYKEKKKILSLQNLITNLKYRVYCKIYINNLSDIIKECIFYKSYISKNNPNKINKSKINMIKGNIKKYIKDIEHLFKSMAEFYEQLEDKNDISHISYIFESNLKKAYNIALEVDELICKKEKLILTDQNKKINIPKKVRTKNYIITKNK